MIKLLIIATVVMSGVAAKAGSLCANASKAGLLTPTTSDTSPVKGKSAGTQ